MIVGVLAFLFLCVCNQKSDKEQNGISIVCLTICFASLWFSVCKVNTTANALACIFGGVTALIMSKNTLTTLYSIITFLLGVAVFLY